MSDDDEKLNVILKCVGVVVPTRKWIESGICRCGNCRFYPAHQRKQCPAINDINKKAVQMWSSVQR